MAATTSAARQTGARSNCGHSPDAGGAVNLAEKFGLFADHWQPRVVGELNGQHVNLVKLLGEFRPGARLLGAMVLRLMGTFAVRTLRRKLE